MKYSQKGISNEIKKKYGARKRLNIITVFKCNFQFPVFLILFVLKYSLTRLFNVLKNFVSSFFEKIGVFVFIS